MGGNGDYRYHKLRPLISYFPCHWVVPVDFPKTCPMKIVSSIRIASGTTQTAGARNKGGNFIGQLCISVVPRCNFKLAQLEHT